MFGIPLPWLIVGLLISLFGTYRGGYHFGWSDRDKEMQVAIAKKNEESRKTEQKLTEQLNANATKLQEVTNVVNEKQSALDRAIRAGRVRISAPSCVQTTTNPTPADSSRDTETSESDRQTLAAIAAIVAEGDAAINQLNACIASYNEMRELVNGKR